MVFYEQALIALAAIASTSAHPHFAHPHSLEDDAIEELSKECEKHIHCEKYIQKANKGFDDHPFGPFPGADFSPCPYHNAMASYGFVNRSGRDIPVWELACVLCEVIGPFAETAALNVLNSEPSQVHYDKDGTPLINFADLWNRPGGDERDASFMFHDAFFGEETRREIDEDLLQDLFSRTDDDYITADSLFQFGADRLKDSLENNPEVSPPYCEIGEDYGLDALKKKLSGFQYPLPLLLDPNLDKIAKHDWEQFYKFGKLPDDFVIRHGEVSIKIGQRIVEVTEILYEVALTSCPLQSNASDEIM